MRYIERLSKPSILEERADEWRSSFVDSDKKRPDHSKYAHRQVRDSLNAMSFRKCFYCERTLKGIPQEVDHFVEVAERKDLAYEWDNLYLACDNCNNKQPNRSIPVNKVLDPCQHSDEEIQQHLTFESEIIRSKHDSEMGRRTSQKYRLDTDQLDLLRLREIKRFYEVLTRINKNIQVEKRGMSNQEREVLLSFQQRDRPFSLMFSNLLKSHNLL